MTDHYCLQCEDRIEGRARQAKFCSPKCKQKYNYWKQPSFYCSQSRKSSQALPLTVYLWRSAKNRATRNGLEFSITVEDIPEVPKLCPVASIRIERAIGLPKPSSPTLDRIDNTKGYIPGNVRVISYQANRWKSNMTPEEIKKLYEYSIGKI